MSRELLDAEYAVLGSLLTNNAMYWTVAERISAADFSHGRNAELFAAIVEGIKLGKPVDPFTLEESHGQDLAHYAMPLWSSGLPSSAPHYADAVRRKAEARRLKAIGQRIANAESYEAAQAMLAEVRPTQTAALKSMRDGLREFAESLQARYNAEGRLTGVSFGIESLDTLTGGMQPADLVILAARPSMGKTAAAIQAAIAAGRTLDFSLEMSAGRLVERVVANVGRLPLRWILFPHDQPDEGGARVLEASKQAAELPLLFDDAAGLTVDQICSRARQSHMQTPLNLIVVDHLGLIARAGKHDPSELGQITTQLKGLAKALNVPVLLLCQLNRSLESRNDKRPVLSDLRDSGRIEEDADTVIGLYRDEYYNKSESNPLRGYAELIVLKQRQGELGTAWARSMLSCMRLESCDEPERPAANAGGDDARGSGQTRGFASRQPRRHTGTGRDHG